MRLDIHESRRGRQNENDARSTLRRPSLFNSRQHSSWRVYPRRDPVRAHRRHTGLAKFVSILAYVRNVDYARSTTGFQHTHDFPNRLSSLLRTGDVVDSKTRKYEIDGGIVQRQRAHVTIAYI